MSRIPFHLVENEGEQTLTLFLPTGPRTVRGDHPYFDAIVDEVREEFPDVDWVLDHSDPESVIRTAFEPLSGRVQVRDGRIFYDGDDVSTGALGKHILRSLEQGTEDWRPHVRFMEKLAANPLEHTKHRLYSWLESTDGFTIAEDGDIIGYKGVRDDRRSVTAGPAIVDGVPVNGHVPNEEGSIIQMARSAVQHDPEVGCSVGLHIGNWDYASRFGSRTIRVKFSPRDVVSVPTDCSDAKVRVCRYEVLADATEKSEAAVEVLGG